MNSIPECSIQRRHSLTEIQNTQRTNFDAMIKATRRIAEPEEVQVPVNIVGIVVPIIVLFIIGLFFI